MKKIVSFLLVVLFLLAGAALSPINRSSAEENPASTANQAELEKIPSPQHLNLYEKVKKVGNSLWGIKKTGQEREKLEKISTLKEIYLYEKVKKVGNALWGVRKKFYTER